VDDVKIAVIHGANLNFTGIRQPDVYGSTSFAAVNKRIEEYCAENKVKLVQFHSNHEGEIIDFIQACHHEAVDGIVINPGAYAHYSHAIADALASVAPVAVEVHLSNIHAREEFRQKSVIARACAGQISGLGIDSYLLAINYLKYRRN